MRRCGCLSGQLKCHVHAGVVMPMRLPAEACKRHASIHAKCDSRLGRRTRSRQLAGPAPAGACCLAVQDVVNLGAGTIQLARSHTIPFVSILQPLVGGASRLPLGQRVQVPLCGSGGDGSVPSAACRFAFALHGPVGVERMHGWCRIDGMGRSGSAAAVATKHFASWTTVNKSHLGSVSYVRSLLWFG